MRHYETTYILRPNLGEEQFTEIIDRTNAIITNDGGAIICLDRWGVKRLAYEINKEIQGYYVYLNYAAPGRTVDVDAVAVVEPTVKLGDAMNAESIEAEKQRIADKAAARAVAQSEDSEGEEFDSEVLEDESTEE